jgi:hypothetical protein
VIYVLSRLLKKMAPLEAWQERDDMRLLETSGYRGHPPRLGRLFDYFNTQFLPPADLRVLDPGGFAVITAPYVHGWERTSTRVKGWHDRDVHLYPPEYHGEETLVYRIYGRDFLAQLRDAGFGVAFAKVIDLSAAITETDVIIASKSPFVEFTGFLPSRGAGA